MPTEYVIWLEEVNINCDENYEGPSGGMEAFAAEICEECLNNINSCTRPSFMMGTAQPTLQLHQ